MAIFVIQSTEFLPDGRRRYYYLETAHSTIEGLTIDLRSGPVSGRQLKANMVDGQFVVHNRRPLMITAAAVHHAYEADVPFVESA